MDLDQSRLEADERHFGTLTQEYLALRAEILSRSNAQHTIINLDVTILGSLIGISLASSSPTAPLLLLAVPLVSNSLGFLYLDHHGAIQRAGRYIEDRIEPEFRRFARSRSLMTWESFFDGNHWRNSTARLLFWAPLSLLFLVGPIACTILTFRFLNSVPGYVTAWVLGIATEIACAVFGVLILGSWWRGRLSFNDAVHPDSSGLDGGEIVP